MSNSNGNGVDREWLKRWHPRLHDHAVERWQESVPHQAFDRPVPWGSIRADLESFSASQAKLQKKIAQKRAEQGAAYKGGGLLELCVAGPGDWFLHVDDTIKKDCDRL